MNKPLTMIIKETKIKLANILNESGLSPIHLDLIMQGFYNEIHSLAEKQALEEEAAYIRMTEEEFKKINDAESNIDSKE